MTRGILVFLAVVVADWIWARYIAATAEKKRWAAATYSAVIILLGGVTTLSLVDDPRYILPAAVGAFVGTAIALRK